MQINRRFVVVTALAAFFISLALSAHGLDIYDNKGLVLQVSDFRSIAKAEIEVSGKKFPAVRLSDLLQHSALRGDSVILKGESRDVSLDWEQAVSPNLYLFFSKNGVARLYSAATKRIQPPNVVKRITVHRTPGWIKTIWYAGMISLFFGAFFVFRYRGNPLARAAAVFAVTLCIYWQFEVPSYGNGSDNMWYVPTAISILHQGNIELSEYGDMIQDANGYGIRIIHGKPYNLFPIGPSIVTLPVIFIAGLIYHGVTPQNAQIFCIAAFTAKIVAALSAALLFMLLLRLTRNSGLTIVLTALFAFGTTNFGLHAGGLWSHNVSLALLLVALLFLQTANEKLLWISALPLALAYITRPTVSVHILLISIFVLIYHRRAFIPFAALGSAIAAVFILFSRSVYGTLLPPYYGAERAFTGSFWEAFAANMISPNRGLLVYTPIFLGSFWGIWVVLRKRKEYAPFWRLLACMAFAHWIVICLSRNWWAGVTVGPRFFSDSLPVWILLLVPAYFELPRLSLAVRRAVLTIFVIAAAWSVFAQARTASSIEPHRWNSSPIPIGYNPERVWDWSDMQILRSEKKRVQIQSSQKSEPASFVLITIDTLRADHLGSYGYGQRTSPGIDRIAAQGERFSKAYSAAPLTLPSHATILSGLYPDHHGVRDNAYFLSPSAEYLQQTLKRAGYATAAFISGAPLLARFGLNRGFDLYDDALSGTERKADRTTDAALRWLNSAKTPFFLWIHYFDPHAEYDPPLEFKKQFQNPYDGEIAFVDAQIQRLVAALDERTYVVITADHGESLGEHGEKTHGVFLYNATLRVPLILRGPGIHETVRDDAVSLCDVAPTILALAHVQNKTASYDGASLLEKLKDRMLLAESLYAARNFGYAPLFAGIRQNKKYIDAPDPEFYNLTIDPSELNNSAANARSDLAPLQKAIRAYKTVPAGSISGPLSTEDAEKLRSLGYLGGTQSATTIDPKSKIAVIESFNEGLGFLKSRDYQNAGRVFRAIAASEPQNSAAYRFLGDALAGQQKYKEAARAFEQSYGRTHDPEAGVQLAKAYFKTGDPDKAESLLKQIVHKFNDYTEARFELASLYAAEGKNDEAFSLLDRESPDFQNQKGILYLTQRDPSRAIVEFSKAAQTDGKADYWNNLGIAYQQAGKNAEAEKSFSHALLMDPDHEQSEANLAFLLIQQQRWTEAEPRLTHVTSRNPSLFRARLALGFVYEKEGKFNLAKRVYEDVLSDAPPDFPDRARVESRLVSLRSDGYTK